MSKNRDEFVGGDFFSEATKMKNYLSANDWVKPKN
jgi:hypothetical protein